MKLKIVLAALALALPANAHAHRAWILPSSTVLSGEAAWVTVDAAVSNDLFYLNHRPLRVEDFAVTQPDGTKGEYKNAATGELRSTFDVRLDKAGTWKIGSARTGVSGSYKLNGEEKRLPRGASAENISTLIPADATEVKITESSSRNEIFVTLGAPTDTVLKPTGQGLELVPVTHPNDLVAGEGAVFRFVIDGKPAEGVELTIIPGGIRYRDAVNEITAKTDAKGEVTITWPEAGMYWLEAEAKDTNTKVPGATERRLGYVSTLEVLTP